MAKPCHQCGEPIRRKKIHVDGEAVYEFCSDSCINLFQTVGPINAALSPEEREQAKEKRDRLDAIVITTAPTIPGNPDYEVIEIITAECVEGMNILRDVFAGVRDLVGGRSESSQRILRDLRKTCLSELRSEALEVGADAVISVDLDYSEFSGGGKSMLFLVASGTAIKFN